MRQERQERQAGLGQRCLCFDFRLEVLEVLLPHEAFTRAHAMDSKSKDAMNHWVQWIQRRALGGGAFTARNGCGRRPQRRVQRTTTHHHHALTAR